MLGQEQINNAVANRLWVAARPRGGSIEIDDVSESDIAHGRANGWLTSASVGHFEATDELRQAATYSIRATDE
jgi:hypothetical protein